MSPETQTGRSTNPGDLSPDLDLVQRSLGDDLEAQGFLLQRLKCIPRILAAKNKRMGTPLDNAELEDLAQDVVLTMWGNRQDFRGQASLETWAYPFCYHALMNRIRKKRREPRTQWVEVVTNSVHDRDPRTEQALRALSALPAGEREVVQARTIQQLSFPNIAETLDIPISTAKHRYYRGLNRLRTSLGPLDSGESHG